jgi:predicted ATPase
VEAGRALIQDQVAIGGAALPWSDQAMFAELMLSWEMRSYQIARRQVGCVFFDRGVPELRRLGDDGGQHRLQVDRRVDRLGDIAKRAKLLD